MFSRRLKKTDCLSNNFFFVNAVCGNLLHVYTRSKNHLGGRGGGSMIRTENNY